MQLTSHMIEKKAHIVDVESQINKIMLVLLCRYFYFLYVPYSLNRFSCLSAILFIMVPE